MNEQIDIEEYVEQKARLDKNGHEILDPRPVEMPVGFHRPETLAEQIQRMVRTEFSEAASNAGFESFEDADDFDVEDEIDPGSPYEMEFDPVLGREVSPQMVVENEERFRQEYLEKAYENEEVQSEGERRRNGLWAALRRGRQKAKEQKGSERAGDEEPAPAVDSTPT